jgi:hypothetical protein
MIARHSFAVVTLVMATTAYAQSDSAAIKQSVTFKAGDVGPYFCPTGWLRSARIVSGDNKLHLIFGKRGASSLPLTGAGGPRCLDLNPGEPDNAAACVRLSEASSSQTTIDVVCEP